VTCNLKEHDGYLFLWPSYIWTLFLNNRLAASSHSKLFVFQVNQCVNCLGSTIQLRNKSGRLPQPKCSLQTDLLKFYYLTHLHILQELHPHLHLLDHQTNFRSIDTSLTEGTHYSASTIWSLNVRWSLSASAGPAQRDSICQGTPRNGTVLSRARKHQHHPDAPDPFAPIKQPF
jgi:hypothetical protein